MNQLKEDELTDAFTELQSIKFDIAKHSHDVAMSNNMTPEEKHKMRYMIADLYLSMDQAEIKLKEQLKKHRDGNI